MLFKEYSLIFPFFFVSFLVTQIKSSFLVLPIRSYKINNIDLNFDMPGISQFIEENMDLQKFTKHWLRQTNFIQLEVGNPPQKIISEVSLMHSMLSITVDQKYQKENNFNFFNYTSSFYNVSKITAYKSFSIISITGAGYDDFHFLTTEDSKSKKYSTKKANLQINLDIHFQDMIGIKPEELNIKEVNQTLTLVLGFMNTKFLADLKHNGLFESYDFKYEFYKNPLINPNEEDDEVGRIIIGKFEEVYDNETYPSEYLKTAKLIQYSSSLTYALELTETYIQKGEEQRISISSRKRGEFMFDESLFIGDNTYAEELQEEFFWKYHEICEKAQSYARSTTYDIYYCTSEIKKYKKEFPDLKFFIKEFNYTFVFTFDDLFREYKGRMYFMVIFPPEGYNCNWVFGKIFLKKYEIIFNPDEKLAKFYSLENTYEERKKEEKERSLFLSILIRLIQIGLIVGLFVVGYFIGKYLNKRRKLRAHELEDNYEYEQGKDYTRVELK